MIESLIVAVVCAAALGALLAQAPRSADGRFETPRVALRRAERGFPSMAPWQRSLAASERPRE